MTGLCFLDTETLGIHPDAPVWEFAAIWRPNLSRSTRDEKSAHFTVQHTPGDWLNELPARFAVDYHARYDSATAWSEYDAALAIHRITKGAHIVGAVPSFDTERLAAILRRNGLEPAWHYHLIDIESLVVGYLTGREQPVWPPWKSDTLALAIGVDPSEYERHTAMGDALWTKAQYDVVMAGH